MLRKLELRDAPFMLEWMQTENVIQNLQADVFRNKNINDCIAFIEESRNDVNNCHRAIVDTANEYLGTVSLKSIDRSNFDAEFAIVIRECAQGLGYASRAMRDILKIAFEQLNLNEVYWNVLVTNRKALQLYKRYNKAHNVCKRWLDKAPRKENGELADIYFFHITKKEYEEMFRFWV